MRTPLPFSRDRTGELTEFLRSADLTTSGIGETDVSLWIDVNADWRIVGSTGFELAGTDALLRSVAVDPSQRGSGRGTELARFAMSQAESVGASRVWLFSRRSGPFWQKLSFQPATIIELANALASTHQVRSFAASGQLNYEAAWSRPLP